MLENFLDFIWLFAQGTPSLNETEHFFRVNAYVAIEKNDGAHSERNDWLCPAKVETASLVPEARCLRLGEAR